VFSLSALVLAALLVLNEIMIRPTQGGSEWIEIFNAGDEAAPLSLVTLEDARGRPVRLEAPETPLEAGGYRVVAASAAKLLASHPDLDSVRVLSLDGTWPILNDSDGSSGYADLVVLRGAGGAVLDSVVYYARWLGAPGVSLERVDAFTSSSLASNWSPSVDDSSSTPLRLNSLSLRADERDRGALLVPREPVFADAGKPPVIAWHLEEPGAIAIELFDLSGRSVRLLKPLEESATVGRVVWDGRDDTGRVVPSGVYLVLLEGRYDGEVRPRRWREPLVVARRTR
jgi:hypothetical protein